MLGITKKLFAAQPAPIGIDFGTEHLRAAQVVVVDGMPRLLAAASARLPAEIRNNQPARFEFFRDALKPLLASAPFKGRRVVLSLPAANMHIQHMRLAKTDEATLKKSLPWETRGKLPIDPTQALLRHVVAGDVFADQTPQSEVIVMAASRQFVEQSLSLATQCKLDVCGMETEPTAVVGCFEQFRRRQADQTAILCFLDVGSTATRVVIAVGGNICFARSIPIGGEQLNRAAADAWGCSAEEARDRRRRQAFEEPASATPANAKAATALAANARAANALAANGAPAGPERRGETSLPDAAFSVLGASLRAAGAAGNTASLQAPPAPPVQPDDARTACGPVARRLADEVNLCRRYHETAFPNKPIERLVFLGGEARCRWLCQSVAQVLNLPAQIGDPMARMARHLDTAALHAAAPGMSQNTGDPHAETGPQPEWCVALGLSLTHAAAAKLKATA